MTDPADDQMMLLPDLAIVLPAVAAAHGSKAGPRTSAPPARSNDTPLGALAAMFTLVPDAIEGVVRVDPRAILVDPVNARHGVPFSPETQGELITSMRASGNTVPVRLRRDPAGGPGYLCPSGSQRLGAALHIQQEEPGFRLRAVIAEAMSDHEAFVLGEADNAGRTGVAPMQQARQWAWTLANVYGGDRPAFVAATGRSASVVSRTLALIALPDYVLACCADTEALTPFFAEQLMPRIGDPATEPAIRRRAEALVATGRRLPAPRLIRALLHDVPATAASTRELWRSSAGQVASFRAGTSGGGRIDLPPVASLAPAERRALIKAVGALIVSLQSN